MVRNQIALSKPTLLQFEVNAKKQHDFQTFSGEVKLAQVAGSTSAVMIKSAVPVNSVGIPLDSKNLTTGLKETSNPYSNKTRSYIPENIQRNDTLVYTMMKRYPNPAKAPKDFILYLSKWFNPQSQKRAPAVYAWAESYLNDYVRMTQNGGDIGRGVTRNRKQYPARSATGGPNKPPKKDDDTTNPVLAKIRDNIAEFLNQSKAQSYQRTINYREQKKG